MVLYYLSLLLIILSLCDQYKAMEQSDPDQFRRTPELITSKGYGCTNYTVLTNDGYLLTVYRVSSGNSSNRTRSSRGTVLLQHGLLDTSSAWVINDNTHSLAFILVDAGFDVWLANSRGNTYSLENIYYSPSSRNFWKFDFDQHASSDLPATIDFILQETGNSEISLVGHSQGATISLAALFRNYGNVTAKINRFVALAPVAYTKYQSSPLLSIMSKLHVDKALKLLPDFKFNLSPESLSKLLGAACTFQPSLCNSVVSSFFGDQGNLNKTRLGVYLAHWPDNTSIRNMIHWIQNVRSAQFYDYSGILYSGTITTPTYVFIGSGDDLSSQRDANTLLPFLKNSKLLVTPFAHMDFTWSELAATLVYPKLIEFLN